MDRYEVRLSGSGGQGLITAGIILAQAAALYDGKNAVQTQSYGPEARGGASKSEVIIADGEIDYPKATVVDAFLALTQEAYDKYVCDLKSNGILLIDTLTVQKVQKNDYQVYQIPMIESATLKLGRTLVSNIVALGALVALTKIVTFDSLKKSVFKRVPPGTEDLNAKALELGMELAAG
ncbi:MAG: 2-oxoacid:acceptor oxidoreductase family protein [bacterium]